MHSHVSLTDLSRGLTVGAAVLLTLVLAALLPQPGYSTTRLAYFLVVVAVAWVGAAGAVWRRPALLLVGAVGLWLLGFWQFTIGLVMLPTAAVYLVTAFLLYDRRNRAQRTGAEGDGGAVENGGRRPGVGGH